MSQKLLDAAKVGASVQQVCRERVPKRVRRNVTVEARAREGLIQDPSDAANGKTPPPLIQKERFRLFGLRAAFQIALDRLKSLFSDRTEPFFFFLFQKL